MAEHLITRLPRTAVLLMLALAAAVAAMAPASATAQEMADPTRPPDSGDDRPAPTAGNTLNLQSILISATRREAVINGQVVRAGGRIGQTKIVKISDNQVLVDGPRGMQVLRMFPGIDKRYVESDTIQELTRRQERRKVQ